MHSSTDAAESCLSEHADFKVSLQQQLNTLIASVKTERSLSDQLLELREEKATMLERLNARDESIAESHAFTLQLQDREKGHVHEIACLNDEVSMLRTQATAAMVERQRLQEVESLMVNMTEEMDKIRDNLTSSQEAVLRRDESVMILKQSLKSSNAELEAATSTIAKLESEKSEFESRANLRYDKMKNQLKEAAKGAREILANEHLDTVQRLQLQKNAADSKARETVDQLARLKADHANEVCFPLHLSFQWHAKKHLGRSL